VGWELAAFIDVTVDAAGTVYALDSYHSAIFVFPASHATSTSSSFVSWLSSSAAESSINTPVLIVAIVVTAVVVVLVWVLGVYVSRWKRAQISSPDRCGYVRSLE
jgi:uncharacterized transporter YbjL